MDTAAVRSALAFADGYEGEVEHRTARRYLSIFVFVVLFVAFFLLVMRATPALAGIGNSEIETADDDHHNDHDPASGDGTGGGPSGNEDGPKDHHSDGGSGNAGADKSDGGSGDGGSDKNDGGSGDGGSGDGGADKSDGGSEAGNQAGSHAGGNGKAHKGGNGKGHKNGHGKGDGSSDGPGGSGDTPGGPNGDDGDKTDGGNGGEPDVGGNDPAGPDLRPGAGLPTPATDPADGPGNEDDPNDGNDGPEDGSNDPDDPNDGDDDGHEDDGKRGGGGGGVSVVPNDGVLLPDDNLHDSWPLIDPGLEGGLDLGVGLVAHGGSGSEPPAGDDDEVLPLGPLDGGPGAATLFAGQGWLGAAAAISWGLIMFRRRRSDDDSDEDA